MGSLGANPSIVSVNSAKAFADVFGVSRETIERLEFYAALLPRWQKAVNLVAKSTLDDVWQRHFADSAQAHFLAPDAGTWVDLGSGGGFPGLVVAILRAGDGRGGVTLIESDTRKCAFLAEVARKASVTVDIVNERIESAATQLKIPQVDIVSARALAPMSKLLALAAPFVSEETVCLFLKGRQAGDEVAAARAQWQFDCELVPSRTDAEASIAVLRRIETKLEG